MQKYWEKTTKIFGRLSYIDTKPPQTKHIIVFTTEFEIYRLDAGLYQFRAFCRSHFSRTTVEFCIPKVRISYVHVILNFAAFRSYTHDVLNRFTAMQNPTFPPQPKMYTVFCSYSSFFFFFVGLKIKICNQKSDAKILGYRLHCLQDDTREKPRQYQINTLIFVWLIL